MPPFPQGMSLPPFPFFPPVMNHNPSNSLQPSTLVSPSVDSAPQVVEVPQAAPAELPIKTDHTIEHLDQVPSSSITFASPLDQGSGLMLVYSDTTWSVEEKRAQLPRYQVI